MDYKLPIVIALVVLLIVIFLWKRSEGVKGTKGTKGRKGGKKATKKREKHSNRADDTGAGNDDDDEDDGDEDTTPTKKGDVAEDAKELYDLVHNELAAGMQIDAFEEAAGDLAGDEPSEVFVALKQKYTEAIDANRDPSRVVSVRDYIEVLKKSG